LDDVLRTFAKKNNLRYDMICFTQVTEECYFPKLILFEIFANVQKFGLSLIDWKRNFLAIFARQQFINKKNLNGFFITLVHPNLGINLIKCL